MLPEGLVIYFVGINTGPFLGHLCILVSPTLFTNPRLPPSSLNTLQEVPNKPWEEPLGRSSLCLEILHLLQVSTDFLEPRATSPQDDADADSKPFIFLKPPTMKTRKLGMQKVHVSNHKV